MQKSAFRYITAAIMLLLIATAPVVAQSSKSIYRVAADATQTGDGSSWENAMPLDAALAKAKAGDEVWVKGYEKMTNATYYRAPSGGFQLRSGVKLYGGLAGTETSSSDAASPKTGSKKYAMTYQSVLLADTQLDDSIPANYIIFPENPTRKNNSKHCLVLNLGVSDDNLNDANQATVVSGFVLAGGNADGAEGSDDGHGGGMLILNRSSRQDDANASKRSYDVSQCYFVNNYASRGGAIYVDPTVTNTDAHTNRIRYCGIYNNASGSRTSNESCGGGVWLGGSATLCDTELYNNTGGGVRLSDKARVVNSTIVHNTVSAVDLTDASLKNSVPTAGGGGAIYNTVLWGSTTLAKTETMPAFRNSAYPEVKVDEYSDTDKNGNVQISYNNFDSQMLAAWFTTPSSDLGYDRAFDFRTSAIPSYSFDPMEESGLLNKGNSTWYTEYVSNTIDTDHDIVGSRRYYDDTTLDIGAIEHEVLSAGRRLYVKTAADGGSDSNDGTSWDKAMASPQAAIDRLYGDGTKGKGEVWVAKGVYSPTSYIKSDKDNDQITPLAFQMRNGISIHGGFKGTESQLAQRELSGEMPWQFSNATIFRGVDYQAGSADWNSTEERWNVSSKSYHVVWFAANPYELKTANDAEFSLATVLDGVTVEGGTASDNGDPKFSPYQGSGIYMMGSNNTVRRCIIRNNNAGMKTSATFGTPQGGGVYNKGGQLRYSLVYNNSASQGGGVYLSTMGFVNNSMVANNSAVNGSGIYVDRSSAPAQYQIIATNVITNNTSTANAALYVKGDALVEQNTVANNYTSNVTDETGAGVTSYTGGLFVTGAVTAINNIIYNNSLRQTGGTESKKHSESMAQVYAYRPHRDSTLFYNNAISDVNSTAWNGIYQSSTYELSTNEFEANESGKQYAVRDSILTRRGVQTEWTTIDYFWRTRKASILRNMGLHYGLLSQNVMFKPSTDMLEVNFGKSTPIGPYRCAGPSIAPEISTKRPHVLRFYYDGNRRTPDGDGSSWDKAYTSMNEILSFVESFVVGGETYWTGYDENGKEVSHQIAKGDSIEIVVREGTYQPDQPYTFQENDQRSACLNVKATAIPLTILGGYPTYEDKAVPTDADRNPAKHRTVFTGNLSGSALDEGLYHVVRVETGADITLDGIVIEKGYAAGTAFQPFGSGVLVGSLYAIDAKTRVKLRDCILENNSAHYGAALAVQSDCRGADIAFVNCVINNNQTNNDDLIHTGDASNTLSLDYVTMINNIGIAPKQVGNTSFAAGNETFDASHVFSTANSNNTIDIATTGKEGAANFANPSNKVGAAMNGNVYYGGNATYRPLTSSTATDAIINHATATAPYAIGHDLGGHDRDLGGTPDLGAYEALLPKAGKVIYVRSYNTDWTEDDCIDGTPDFNLLNDNPTNVYDGSTWSRAIQGNAVCDTTQMYADGNAMYVRTGSGQLIAATLDNTQYGADYNAKSAPYGQTSNAYSGFFSSATSSKKNGNYTNLKRSDGTLYNLIGNNRDERYISGLQLAVEKAARYNAAHKDDADYEEMTVWVAAGVYTDFKGFVIRNGVKVYGGFPKDGNPGENDRRPLLSQYVPARKDYEGLNKADYETILQVRKESPVYLTKSSREIWYQEGKPSDGSNYDFIDKLINAGTTERHCVLYQPDVCLPTYGVSGDGLGSCTGANQYRTKDFPKYFDPKYQEYENAKWDGFSIRHGYITNYMANRDGGAGVRVFRGIRMENLIIVNNFTHGSRSRGGGMYLDGDNSIISNSFMLRNFVYGQSDCYGGGAYMIQGVGYNLVVASNRSWSYGGGIFIESAKFFNNTVAYNMTNQSQGAGIMHWQDPTTGITSALTLYNCLVYDNFKNDDGNTSTKSTQIGSTSPNTFHESYNNYINGSLLSALASKFTAANGNVTTANTPSMPYPFAISGNDTRYSSSQGKDVDGGIRFSKARAANDFRLNEGDGLSGNPCLNGGTEDMPTVPATDMDYTDRIKDCTIDIGAYEADNSANITPEKKTRTKTTGSGTSATTTTETYYVYYVTETGYGNRSGSDPENAACADKLQSVLTAAGKFADSLDYKYKVYVKVAGYEPDEDGERFVYHVNTLADTDDPQSYTYLIPQGVWMYGGYNEGTWETVTSGTTTTRRLTGYNWDDDTRDVITSFQTVLSAKTQPRTGSAVEEVTGYHVVSFGKYPKGEYADYGLHALPGKTVDGKLVNPSTGIDGVRLIDGAATDNDGMKGMGGGAVVPAYAHVRNSVITDCQAIKGGALFMLPGSFVSGSVIHGNNARQGGAIYTANGKSKIEEYNEYRAYMASCTVCDNSATEGGGIYQELGALFGGNSVIWGNTATTDKNISGVLDQKFKDQINHSADPTSTVYEYYPYNACFVERYLVSGDLGNTSMTSDFETYFATAGEYYPRPYSPLINKGVTKAYQRLWESFGVATHDVKGVARGMKDFLTAGAYAMVLPDVADDVLLTRLFVSADGGAEVSEELKAKYVGRSFYTPFNSLDAALSYINHARTNNIGTATSPRYLATVDTPFEILIAGGTYRPSVVRTSDSDVSGSAVADRRMQSFELPMNVYLFGGFDNADPYSSDPVLTTQTGGTSTTAATDMESLIEITDVNGNKIKLDPDQPIADILAYRNTKHRSDLNKNGLLEPWEFANPTILSGNIKASETERKVYHVVYSRAEQKDIDALKDKSHNIVVLDGLTIVNGETSDAETDDYGEEDLSDFGHGGGIFAWNVNYTLNRCRVLRNKAVHGGGIFAYNANLNIIGSAVSGNMAQSESDETTAAVTTGRGGGVCAVFTGSGKGSLNAINSLFANNSAEGNGHNASSEGGAIFVKPGDITDKTFQYMNLVNCNIVRNRANLGGALYVNANTSADVMPTLLTNTVLWGNESLRFMTNGAYKPSAHLLIYDKQMSHCASDLRSAEDSEDVGTRAKGRGNVIIDRDNFTATGPRFMDPSTTAGYDGFNVDAQWNPAAISVLTDAGEDSLKACENKDYDNVYKDALDNKLNVYTKWWRMQPQHIYDASGLDYAKEYINNQSEPNDDKRYRRFVGPADARTGRPGTRQIDIGMYEFQYKFKFSDLEAVYIGTREAGDGSGDSWKNQSTDLRGAIIAMSNPTGNTTSVRKTNRHVYVRGGEYYSPLLTGGDAFSLIVNPSDKREFVTSVELVGSCIGGTMDKDGNEPQDFADQTVIVPNPMTDAATPVNNLLNITANGRPVTISGFTFSNTHEYTGDNADKGGRGINADIRNTADDKNASLTLKNCAFTGNRGTGLNITNNEGSLLLYNVLFADGLADGMDTRGKTTVVNATFAQNKGYDYLTLGDGSATDVYNSVSWQNGGTSRKHTLTDDDTRRNTSFAWGTVNEDVLNGPNFTDPKKGDYSLRPSVKLFNTGDSTLYIKNALGIASISTGKDYMSKEHDLQHEVRIVGGDIDRGAYECTSKLLPIIYVKTGVTTLGSGESWALPTGSLQNAINLAELYANTSNGDNASKSAYVFVDKNVSATEARITLPGVKVYGTMDNETSLEGGDTEPTDYDKEQVEAIVKDLLAKRKGLLEQTTQSRVRGLSIDYTPGDKTDNHSDEPCVVDGFYVDGKTTLRRGYLATSILAPTDTLSGTKDGMLYNSLVYGTVADVRSVNVTAVKSDDVAGSGTLPDVVDDKGNSLCAANRTNVTVQNRYVDDEHWRWQLNDYLTRADGTADYSKLNADIDANADSTLTVACANAVGHRRDVAGNLRFRVFPTMTGDNAHFNYVDNGCFETWYVPTIYTATTADYPRGKSAIYVREEQRSTDDRTMRPFSELRLAPGLYTESNPFTPGFLLLKHHAGLRGNGNYISLDNLGVEREFHARNTTAADGTTTLEGYPDLCVMPFSTTKREQFEQGTLEIDGTNDLYRAYAYNGLTRAAYDFKYDAVDGNAWEDAVLATDLPTEGLMIVPHKDFTLRFYTNRYNEHGPSAALTLQPYCFQEPWSTTSSGGVRFTHKENMGWNLFGSPFLCALNYSDMAYGRVLYIDNILTGGGYDALNTTLSDGTIAEGYIPACDAVFTQTATLGSREQVIITHSAELSGEAYQGARTLRVALSQQTADEATRATDGSVPTDALQLNAVDAADAHSGFDISTDGVKWMNREAPQLYALDAEGRYSLLSAVSREGEVKVGVSLPEAGTYTLNIPSDCDTDGYEAVLLKDRKTGRSVDLLDAPYQFAATEKGEQNARFTISFNKKADGTDGIVVRKVGTGRIRVSGLRSGDTVRLYLPNGMIANQAQATSSDLTMSTGTDGVVIVEVTRDGRQACVRKLK